MTKWPFKITGATLDVIQALAEAKRETYGLEIAKRTGRFGSTVVPILEKLHEARWVTRHWEHVPTKGERRDRPPRRYYRLTKEGARQARLLLDERRPPRTVFFESTEAMDEYLSKIPLPGDRP